MKPSAYVPPQSSRRKDPKECYGDIKHKMPGSPGNHCRDEYSVLPNDGGREALTRDRGLPADVGRRIPALRDTRFPRFPGTVLSPSRPIFGESRRTAVGPQEKGD